MAEFASWFSVCTSSIDGFFGSNGICHKATLIQAGYVYITGTANLSSDVYAVGSSDANNRLASPVLGTERPVPSFTSISYTHISFNSKTSLNR